MDRRSQRRYGLQGTGSIAWSFKSPLEDIPIVNWSFGGLCVEVTQQYRIGAVHELRVDLRGPLDDLVSVTAVVRWVERVGQRWCCGTEVLESDKAWIGPKEE